VAPSGDPTTPPDPAEIALLRGALAEDLGEAGDITSIVSVPEHAVARAVLLAKQDGVLAGVRLGLAVFRLCDPAVRCEVRRGDGDVVASGDEVLSLVGNARALLAAERTALNLMQRLSGIATRTRAFVDAIAGTDAKILDTRKTTPGLRAFEREAVRLGGGINHREGLYDRILLKENHFALAGRPFRDVVAAAVGAGRGPVIAEATDVDEAVAAVEGGASVVLLDNFSVPAGLAEGVAAVRGHAERLGRTVAIEASGGVRLETVRAIAACGVDRISIGSLTHSYESLDLSLLLEPVREPALTDGGAG
jgi:nicotinate-nucleotide pyrophosphorylase (carboxylating)